MTLIADIARIRVGKQEWPNVWKLYEENQQLKEELTKAELELRKVLKL